MLTVDVLPYADESVTESLPGQNNKTTRLHDKETKRPKREIYIVISGQFCTCAMFLMHSSAELLCEPAEVIFLLRTFQQSHITQCHSFLITSHLEDSGAAAQLRS